MNRLPAIFIVLSLALALGAAALWWRIACPDGASGPVVGGQAEIGGSFTLTDQNGRPRSDRDFRGHWAIVYFGYTYCPDVCPTTLSEIADALHRLGPKARRFVPLFITLDPERDHPATLRKYLAAFGPEFVGLTGSPGKIASVAHSYRVYYAKHPLSGGSYSIDHASALYLLSPDGQFAGLADGQDGAAALAKDLESHLQAGQP
ncbi:MAG TPA: SCO family protein [Rhizomicrobium sp.]|jgi:protein SCO1/2